MRQTTDTCWAGNWILISTAAVLRWENKNLRFQFPMFYIHERKFAPRGPKYWPSLVNFSIQTTNNKNKILFLLFADSSLSAAICHDPAANDFLSAISLIDARQFFSLRNCPVDSTLDWTQNNRVAEQLIMLIKIIQCKSFNALSNMTDERRMLTMENLRLPFPFPWTSSWVEWNYSTCGKWRATKGQCGLNSELVVCVYMSLKFKSFMDFFLHFSQKLINNIVEQETTKSDEDLFMTVFDILMNALEYEKILNHKIFTLTITIKRSGGNFSNTYWKAYWIHFAKYSVQYFISRKKKFLIYALESFVEPEHRLNWI